MPGGSVLFPRVLKCFMSDHGGSNVDAKDFGDGFFQMS